MKVKVFAIFILIILFAFLIACVSALAAEESKAPILSATEAEEWTALFDRCGESGWLGADGIYSVSLDGNDAFAGASENTNSCFIFSDTLMGVASSSGEVIYRAGMPAQSSALLKGRSADKEAISFVYGEGGNGNLGEHLFGEHKWLLDCYVKDSTLYILGFPEQNWKPRQIDMISVPIENGEPIYSKYEETENITELWRRIGDEYLYAFGIGITANTVEAGAEKPDGYIYVYGYRDAMQEMSRKDLIVGRIHEDDFPDFSKFTYWNGNGWGNDIEDCAILLTDVSCEMSVSFVPMGPFAGKYIAIYTQYTRSSNIMYAIGDTPYGPFDTPVKCYDAFEHGEIGAGGKGNRVVYNAKAHPHLSRGDMLLISYNVNVEGDGARQWTTDYHPRFLWLDLDPDNDVDLDSENADFVEQSSSEYNPALAVIAIVTVVIAIGTGVCFAWVKK